MKLQRATICLLLLSFPLFANGQNPFEQRKTIDVSTSVIVLGDTNSVPLDKFSLNGLFTSAFSAEVGKQLSKSIPNDSSFDMTPSMVEIVYLADNENRDDGETAQLIVRFADPPEDLVAKLKVEAPRIALELMKERVESFFNRLRDESEREQVERLENLQVTRNDLRTELESRQSELIDGAVETIESADDLRNSYRNLKHQQRDDRLRMLGVAAKREAIEKQVKKISRISEASDVESKLMDELKLAADAQRQRLDKLRQVSEEGSQESELLKNLIAEKKGAVAIARAQFEAGQQSASDLQKLRTSLAESEYKLEAAKREMAERIHQAEAQATQAAIAYFVQQEHIQQSQSGGQLEKLNGMLTQLAIETDEAEARKGAVAEELDRLAHEIREQMQNEMDSRQLQREVARLEEELNRAEHELREVQRAANRPPRKEFAIVPWGP